MITLYNYIHMYTRYRCMYMYMYMKMANFEKMF